MQGLRLINTQPLHWVAAAPQVGVFNEVGFQRLDLIMSEATKNNIHIIFPFVNYWPDLGGMQWYVDEVCGRAPLNISHEACLPQSAVDHIQCACRCWAMARPAQVVTWSCSSPALALFR